MDRSSRWQPESPPRVCSGIKRAWVGRIVGGTAQRAPASPLLLVACSDAASSTFGGGRRRHLWKKELAAGGGKIHPAIRYVEFIIFTLISQ
jgi:hypothetical protein